MQEVTQERCIALQSKQLKKLDRNFSKLSLTKEAITFVALSEATAQFNVVIPKQAESIASEAVKA